MSTRRTFILSMMLLGLFSCTKEEPQEVLEWTDLSVCVEGRKATVQSKAELDKDAESRIGDVQLFVFREDGTLDGYTRSKGADITVKCTVGKRNVCAVVNCGEDLSGIRTSDELTAVSTRLTDNSLDSFVMTGEESIHTSLTSSALVLNVDRVVSRVLIRKVTNSLLNQYAGAPVEITAVYLINAAADREALMEPETKASEWHNKLWYQTGRADKLLYEKVNRIVESGRSDSQVRTFYACPNLTEEDSHDEDWSPRHTRLVVETRILGRTYYYPMTLPVMRSNHSYEIKELVIRHLGASSADGVISPADASFTVNVNDWTFVRVTGPDDDTEGKWTI